ncbi:MAG: hypothetical protein ACRCYV_08090 [Aeromonas sp.]
MKRSLMLKQVMAGALFVWSVAANAGAVNGQLAKIRVYERGDVVEFQSRFPKVSYFVSHRDVYDAMTTGESIDAVVDVVKDGILEKFNEQTQVTLAERDGGLQIRGDRVSMFVGPREITDVRL